MRKCQEADSSPETPETISDKDSHHLSEEAAEEVQEETKKLHNNLDHIKRNEHKEVTVKCSSV